MTDRRAELDSKIRNAKSVLSDWTAILQSCESELAALKREPEWVGIGNDLEIRKRVLEDGITLRVKEQFSQTWMETSTVAALARFARLHVLSDEMAERLRHTACGWNICTPDSVKEMELAREVLKDGGAG